MTQRNNLEQKMGLNDASRIVRLFQINCFRKINLKQPAAVNYYQHNVYGDSAVTYELAETAVILNDPAGALMACLVERSEAR